MDAVKQVHRHLWRGYADAVDADLSKYFDTIPHSELINSVARGVALEWNEDVVKRHLVQVVHLWSVSEVAARHIEVGSMGYSGLDLLTLRSSQFDLNRSMRQPSARRLLTIDRQVYMPESRPNST